MAPFLGLKTLQKVFYSVVNALNYDLIIFFIEKIRSFPLNTLEFKHLEVEEIVSENQLLILYALASLYQIFQESVFHLNCPKFQTLHVEALNFAKHLLHRPF